MEQRTNTTPFGDSSTAYGPISRFNHWIVAAAMIGLLVSGLVMAYGSFPRETVAVIRDWHKPIGILVLGYGLWRIGWRIVQGFPKGAARMPHWQTVASKVAHLSLLASVLMMPTSGLIMSIYAGHDVGALGFIIPGQAKVEWVSNFAGLMHQYTGFALIGLLIVHVGAALKHHFIDRDATLRRMVGGRT